MRCSPRLKDNHFVQNWSDWDSGIKKKENQSHSNWYRLWWMYGKIYKWFNNQYSSKSLYSIQAKCLHTSCSKLCTPLNLFENPNLSIRVSTYIEMFVYRILYRGIRPRPSCKFPPECAGPGCTQSLAGPGRCNPLKYQNSHRNSLSLPKKIILLLWLYRHFLKINLNVSNIAIPGTTSVTSEAPPFRHSPDDSGNRKR